MRPTRTQHFMDIARLVAQRSTCKRANVGAVLVSRDNHIVSSGYNGSPPGSHHCLDVGCLMHKDHCIRTIHAELNAILNLEHRYEGLTLYCTHQPCLHCYKALYTIKVEQIYYLEPYKDDARDALIFDLGFPQVCKMVQMKVGI